MTRAPVLAVLALALGLGLGCKAKPEAGEAGDQARTEVERVVAEAPSHPQTVALDQAGSEPREVLRYAGPAPTRELILATHTSQSNEGIGSQPFIEIHMGWAGTEAGAARWEVVGLAGEMVERQRDGFSRGLAKAFETVDGRFETDVRGTARIVQTGGHPTTPNIPAQLELFVVPLPEQAIGIGASWTATARYTLDDRAAQRPDEEPGVGGEVTMVERYTLLARDGDQLTIEYALSTTAALEGFMASEAKGRLLVGLDDPLAFEGSIEHRAQIGMPAVDGVEATARYNLQRFVLRTL